jgi:beta-galactosidase
MTKSGKFKIVMILGSILILSYGLLSFQTNNENPQRVRYSINKNEWKFFLGEEKDAYKKSFDDSKWLNVTIPHDFDGGSDGVNNTVFLGRFDFKNDPDKRLMYLGPGWYRTKFTIDKQYAGKKIFIDFEAVSLEAKVWVNGKEAGGHKGGYTGFSIDITDLVKPGSENILVVRADNSNNPAIAPWMADEKNSFPYSYDYTVYGGIYRDVWISITDPVKIEKVFNTPVCGGQAPAVLTIETRVKNYSKITHDVSLNTMVFDPQGKLVSTLKTTKTINGGGEITYKQMESALGKIQLWDIDNPNLYKVISTISYENTEVDNYESTFGFRYFTLANNTAFRLNGKKLLIRGVNRHQDMEGVGYAMPNEQHRRDVELLKSAGFNFIRHAHYPCDVEFAKACNELGVMLWLEIPLTGSTSQDPAFLENCKSQLTEMIEEFYNDPAVIVWGIGNESDRSGAPESASNDVFGELVKLAKKLDATRPTTGCNYQYESNQKLVDVYAPQDWSGWYSGTLSEYKPTSIIGEYGSDIHYPNHSEQKFDPTINYNSSGIPDFWSQEYGAFLHEYKVSVGEARADSFPGQCMWVGFDFASPRLGRGMNPIPYMNQKGIFLHDHKTPKDIFYFYQSMYRKASDYPMVYIVSESWTDRWTEPARKDVWVYSNCDSVELFNDYGKISFGKRTKNAGPRGDTRFQWDSADVKYNVLYAEGWFNNAIVARDTILLKNLPQVPK